MFLCIVLCVMCLWYNKNMCVVKQNTPFFFLHKLCLFLIDAFYTQHTYHTTRHIRCIFTFAFENKERRHNYYNNSITKKKTKEREIRMFSI